MGLRDASASKNYGLWGLRLRLRTDSVKRFLELSLTSGDNWMDSKYFNVFEKIKSFNERHYQQQKWKLWPAAAFIFYRLTAIQAQNTRKYTRLQTR